MTARDIRYGRQGGRWATDIPAMPDYDHRAFDPASLIRDPDLRARSAAHAALASKPARLLCPANESRHVADCTCRPTSEQTADEWSGQARMARARKAAGVRLTALDLQALDRYPA